MTQAEVLEEFRAAGALLEGHFVLSSGLHSPIFLQNLKLPRLDGHSPTGQVDVLALDIIRDREHGVPRFNEFRRQYGLTPREVRGDKA